MGESPTSRRRSRDDRRRSAATTTQSSSGRSRRSTPVGTPEQELAKAFIRDLSFWGDLPIETQTSVPSRTQQKDCVGPRKSTSYETLQQRRQNWKDSETASSSTQQQQSQLQQTSQAQPSQSLIQPGRTFANFLPRVVPKSPTLQELRDNCPWHTAVDPASGRTYYYEPRTRHTQWEKPREIRAIERKVKLEQRQRDTEFFRIMELNVVASLERGERIPLCREPRSEGPPREPDDSVVVKRVRTISGMNEHMLQQLLRPTSHSSTHTSSHKQPQPQHQQIPRRQSSSPVNNGVGKLAARPPLPKPRSNRELAQSTETKILNTASAGGDTSTPTLNSLDSLELSPDQTRGDANDTLVGVDLLNESNGDCGIGNEETGSSATDIPTVSFPPPSRVDTNRLAPLSHIRRNTANGCTWQTGPAAGTMETPNVDATIQVVCSVLRAHILESMVPSKHAPSPVTATMNLRVFDDHAGEADHSPHSVMMSKRPPPSVAEIQAFYLEFYQRSQMEFDAIIMSLIYIERIIKQTNGALMPTPDNWESVLFSCMVLASKVWDDLSMWNVDFSNVSAHSSVLARFSLQRINRLERAVLACLNFAVAISGSEYAKYYYLLRNIMIRGGLLNPQALTLTADAAHRLEDRTSAYQDTKVVATVGNTNNNDCGDGPRRRQAKSVDWSALSGQYPEPKRWNSTSNTKNMTTSMASPPQDLCRDGSDFAAGPVLLETVCLEQLASSQG